MTRVTLAFLALSTFAACGEGPTSETYTCANGPDLGVIYDEDKATLLFPSGRREVLFRAQDGAELYSRAGLAWDARDFRTARLTEPTRSFQCDQMG